MYIYRHIHTYIHICIFLLLYEYIFISLNVYKCLMCCAATDRTACESGQVKNTEIQQRLPWFRTLGMTLSRGKSPQTAKHPFWNIMLVLVHHRPVRPSVRPFARHLFPRPFLSATTSSLAHALSSSATGLSTTTTVVRERHRDAGASNLIHFSPGSFSVSLYLSLSPPFLFPLDVSRDPDVFSNFYARIIIFIWHVSIRNNLSIYGLAFYRRYVYISTR